MLSRPKDLGDIHLIYAHKKRVGGRMTGWSPEDMEYILNHLHLVRTIRK